MSVSAALGYPGLVATLRMKDGAPFKSDTGNVIYDCAFKAIKNAAKLGKALSDIPGVVDHGLFVGLATALIIARKKGVEVIERKPAIRK